MISDHLVLLTPTYPRLRLELELLGFNHERLQLLNKSLDIIRSAGNSLQGFRISDLLQRKIDLFFKSLRFILAFILDKDHLIQPVDAWLGVAVLRYGGRHEQIWLGEAIFAAVDVVFRIVV